MSDETRVDYWRGLAKAHMDKSDVLLGRLATAHASLDRIQAVVGRWEEHGYDVEAAHLAELIRRCLPDDLNLPNGRGVTDDPTTAA